MLCAVELEIWKIFDVELPSIGLSRWCWTDEMIRMRIRVDSNSAIDNHRLELIKSCYSSVIVNAFLIFRCVLASLYSGLSVLRSVGR